MKYVFFALLIFSLIVSFPASGAYSDVSIEIDAKTSSTCPCSTLTSEDIDVVVKNLGTSRETFAMSLDFPVPELWSGFITPSITLSPEEEGRIGAIFITPSCSIEPGVYVVGIIAYSNMSVKSSIAEFPVEVLKCHWIEIEAEDYDLCQGIEMSFEINLLNEGQSDERVKVSASEPWVNFPVDTFEVKKGETKPVEVLFLPPADETGIKDVTIIVESETSYVRQEKTVKANVRKCYSAALEINPWRQDVCPCKTADFLLIIENSGLIEDEYAVSYENRSTEESIKAGESAEIELSVNIPCDKQPGDYPVEVTIDSHTPGEPSMTVTVLPYSECYSVELAPVNATSKTVPVGKAATYSFTINNLGKFRQAYNLSVVAPDWVHLSDPLVEIGPGDGKDAYLYAAPGYYVQAGNYSASVTAQSAYEKTGLEFTVNVLSDFTIIAENETAGNLSEGNISMNISIPTGGIIAGGVEEKERPWTQIILITILAVGVVIILILRFVVMMK